MNERVRQFRQRQRDKGLTEVSIWLDSASVTLLKREAQNRQPGEVVGEALKMRYGNDSVSDKGTGSNEHSCNVSEIDLLQKIREVIREEFARGERICNASEAASETGSEERFSSVTEAQAETAQEAQQGGLTKEPPLTIGDGQSGVVAFGVRLRAARIGMGWSQRRLAAESGVGSSTIATVEGGGTPSPGTISKLVGALPSLGI